MERKLIKQKKIAKLGLLAHKFKLNSNILSKHLDYTATTIRFVLTGKTLNPSEKMLDDVIEYIEANHGTVELPNEDLKTDGSAAHFFAKDVEEIESMLSRLNLSKEDIKEIGFYKVILK
jgi:hypothetical protein